MIHEFHTDDSPQRPGYRPTEGTACWSFTFPLHNGDGLKLSMGKDRRADFIKILNEESIANVYEEVLRHGASTDDNQAPTR